MMKYKNNDEKTGDRERIVERADVYYIYGEF